MSKNKQQEEDIDLGELSEITMNNNKYKQMWLDLAQVEGFQEYLRETVALDMKRKWSSVPTTHERIHGHADLALYFIRTLKAVKEKRNLDVLDKES